MKWTSLNDLREAYLSFFESKGHLRHASYSLVPQGDKSLLLINAGMAPLKKYFTGEEEPPRRRMTTCQKCVRTLDIDNVGKTARHGTYFEMLGNFSFGDYFKNEAIPWAWEFLTEVLEIPTDLLYPSVFEEDDEAFEIWNKKVGVPAEKIVRLGRADNFWEHGSGPCGPCSEIYFDRGEKYGCGSPDCGPGCECDRFIEVWNNVFTQFNSDGKGTYTELESKNIDTGMGLERLACVMQGVDNLFEVDTIRKILDKVCEISGVKYNSDYKHDVSIRVITDHTRSATFLISDGVLPSNEGRGYVLRRLIRRAARHGRLLGIEGAFLTTLADVVIEENKGAYPEVEEKRDYIKKILSLEEEKFDATIDQGLSILQSLIENASDNKITGDDAFKLYDTFGFPIDLTREIVEEKGLSLDEDRFTELMKEQKERARSARKNVSGWDGFTADELSQLEKTEFCGYTETSCTAKIVALLNDEGTVDEASEGDVRVILDKTPFYGEGGGQVGDIGSISTESAELEVIDTKKNDGVYIHICTVANGTIKIGDTVTATIDTDNRSAVMRNHSACHLLQAALRKVLGNHVEQAGSFVDAKECRFDFSHFSAVTPEELAKVEALVNTEILKGTAVETVETDIETARANGAMALFGEKYGKIVRMVKMGDFSTELCGGTHLDATSKIGLFKIVSESSVASGVRRIVGVTGLGVLEFLSEKEELIASAAKALKANNPADIGARAAQVMGEVATQKKEIEALNSKLAAGKTDDILASATAVGSVKLATADLGAMSPDAARSLADKLRDKDGAIVAVLALHAGDKLNFLAVCGPDAVKAGAHAGKLVGAVATVAGGKGGGRPDSAMSGGRDLDKIADALASAEAVLAEQVK
ncbi:MAG: alanine--tRNA ligase [Ruminococcaceae bacterium]|nr:alanine--tRNA ligase [Oscillospiraceae bacterium]